MKRKRAAARVWRHPRAEDDLLEIWLYVARDSIAAADKLIDAITKRCNVLVSHPEIGPARPDIAPDARMLTVGKFLVLYRVLEKRIEIVRVVHGARRLDDIF